jgi:hypothetical protein
LAADIDIVEKVIISGREAAVICLPALSFLPQLRNLPGLAVELPLETSVFLLDELLPSLSCNQIDRIPCLPKV